MVYVASVEQLSMLPICNNDLCCHYVTVSMLLVWNNCLCYRPVTNVYVAGLYMTMVCVVVCSYGICFWSVAMVPITKINLFCRSVTMIYVADL